MELTLEKFTKLKDNYLEMVISGTKDAGGLPPHLTLFGHEKSDEEKQAIIHVPITDDLMTTEGKTKLFDVVIPLLAEQVSEKFKIYALAWSSEAWVREANKDQKVINWKELPIKKEVIIINFESTVKNECVIYEMKRDGHKVSETGDLIDNIELVEYPSRPEEGSQGGNLTGLLKHFLKTEK